MLNQRIQAEINCTDANIYVLIKELRLKQVIFSLGEDKQVVSASLIKVPIMLEALPRDTDGRLLQYIIPMITESDNDATNVLIDLLGMDAINTRIKALGLTQTVLERKMLDFQAIEEGRNNYTSLTDMLHLFEQIYHKPEPLEILKNQKDKAMFPRYIPAPLNMAHKTGELDHLNHDVGIIFQEDHVYFVGICVTDVENNEIGAEIIGRLGKIIYEELL